MRVEPFAVAVCGLAFVGILLRWTPSSYGVALSILGHPDAGLIWGTPRPIRSDEWAVWTPFVQSALRNDFARFDALSPFTADLRNFNLLPLLDWALPLKPLVWPFFLTGPATAFSAFHLLPMALFLIGWERLWRAFGIARGMAAAASVLLFFTGYAQFWWTTTGPQLALFPWLMLTILRPWPAIPKFLAVGAMTAVWLLGHVYPPVAISLAFAGGLLLLAFRPETLWPRRLFPIAGGALVGLGLVVIYLYEPLVAMATTIYPGQRLSTGGEMPRAQWLAQIFPAFSTDDHYNHLVHGNICEAGTAGTLLPLFALCFADWRNRAAFRDPALLRRVALPLAAFGLASAWQLLPISSAWGALLLWDRVPGVRMTFAAGVLLLAGLLALLHGVGARLTLLRCGLAALGVLAAWVIGKGLADNTTLGANRIELLVLPLLLGAWWWVRDRSGAAASMAIVLVAALSNAALFGRFNPIQGAKQIMAVPRGPVTAQLDAAAARHPAGWPVDGPGLPGAIAAGLGYRTPQTVVIRPQFAFFRRFFPDLPEPEFQRVFNRYAHVALDRAITAPEIIQADAIRLPLAPFLTAPD